MSESSIRLTRTLDGVDWLALTAEEMSQVVGRWLSGAGAGSSEH